MSIKSLFILFEFVVSCRFAPIDFQAFDESAVDSASKIINMFTKQNQRVLKIFDNSADEEDDNVEDKLQVRKFVLFFL